MPVLYIVHTVGNSRAVKGFIADLLRIVNVNDTAVGAGQICPHVWCRLGKVEYHCGFVHRFNAFHRAEILCVLADREESVKGFLYGCRIQRVTIGKLRVRRNLERNGQTIFGSFVAFREARKHLAQILAEGHQRTVGQCMHHVFPSDLMDICPLYLFLNGNDQRAAVAIRFVVFAAASGHEQGTCHHHNQEQYKHLFYLFHFLFSLYS